MKKFSFTSFWLILLVATSHASITLSGTFVTNAEDLDGSALSDDRLGLVVVDTSTTDPNASGSFAAATQGGLLSGASLDIGQTFGSSSNIILARTSTSTGDFSTSVTGVSGVSFPTGVAQGNPFGLFVFNDISSDAVTVSASDVYGFYRNPAVGSDSWNLPADGATVTFGSALAQGADVEFGDLSVAIPEPSAYATILGLLGLGYAVFCRRRRSSSTD